MTELKEMETGMAPEVSELVALPTRKADLNTLLLVEPKAAFLMRVQGDSMIGAGINPEDILIVHGTSKARDRQIVIAEIDGKLTVKRYRLIENRVVLMPENEKYKPIIIFDETKLKIWGVVTQVIRYF